MTCPGMALERTFSWTVLTGKTDCMIDDRHQYLKLYVMGMQKMLLSDERVSIPPLIVSRKPKSNLLLLLRSIV